MLDRLSIPTKAVLTSVPLYFLVAFTQQALFVRVVSSEAPQAVASVRAQPGAAPRIWRETALVICAFGLFVGLTTVGWAGYIVRHRTRRLAYALARIGDGELHEEMPPAIDADLAIVREAIKSMRSKLAALTSRLEHTDAQRRRLFADLAHELATPTSSILAISEALSESNSAGRINLVEALEREATRLERLVSDVRELAALDDPDIDLQLERANIGVLARRVVAHVDVARDAGAPLTCDIRDDERSWVQCDVLRMDQVLTNLLTNARRYTPPDGKIVVGVERSSPRSVRLTVDDSGAGVPEEFLPRLGERMLRIDASRSTKTGNHGLGLSIVSAVVVRHGGTLRFQRSSLGGLSVVIELPASDAG